MPSDIASLNKLIHKKNGSLVFAMLADLQWEQGFHDAATETLETGLAKHPSFIPGLMIKVKILRHFNKNAEAETLLHEILETDPMHLAAQKHLTQIYIAQDKAAEASALLQRMKELDSLSNDLPVLPAEMQRQLHPYLPQSTQDLVIEKDALFASLEDAFLDEDEPSEEKSAAELQDELDAALANTPAGTGEPEFFPTDEEALASGGDVGSAITEMLGEEPPADNSSSTPSIPTEPPQEETPAATQPSASVEPTAELEQSALAQELVSSPIEEESTSSPIEKESTPPPLQQITTPPPLGASVFSSFTPEPPPYPQEPSEDSGFFEKSEETNPKPASAPPKSMDLANALDELFGEEDELPIETSSTQPPTPAPESKEDIPADAPQEEITPENLAEPEVSTPDNAPVDDLSNSEEDQPGVAASSMEEILGTEVPPTVAEPPSPHEAPIPLEDISSALFEDTPVVPQESEELSAEKNDVAEAIDSLLGEDEAPIEGHITSSGQISPEDTQASILEAPTIRASEEEGKNEETEKDENLGGDVSNALNDLFGAELDEDLSDLMDPPKQQPSPASTQTLADLYLSQGHPQDALQVLQDLDAREPGDPDIQAQIQDIQKRMDAGEFGQS